VNNKMAFAVFGYIMMASMIISPGVTAGIHCDDIRKAIDTAQQHKDDLENKWKQVFTAQGKLDKNLKIDIVNSFEAINDSITSANAIHTQFQQANAQIQMIGIMMVMLTFFLLLMKHYDLFINPFTLFSKK
jgi:hypothetical protein